MFSVTPWIPGRFSVLVDFWRFLLVSTANINISSVFAPALLPLWCSFRWNLDDGQNKIEQFWWLESIRAPLAIVLQRSANN